MVTGRPPVITEELVLEERSMLPPMSDSGVAVGRTAESVLRLAVHPEYAHGPTILRFRSSLGRLVILSHPLECRSMALRDYFSYLWNFGVLVRQVFQYSISVTRLHFLVES